MACCPHARDDAGYATPAAMVFCLVIALAATALVARSLSLLKMARNDLRTFQAEYLLAGSHLAAGAAVVRTDQPAPYAWRVATDAGWVDLRAEPEFRKLSLAAGAALSDDQLRRLGASDPVAVRQRLLDMHASGDWADIGDLAQDPLWRDCAPRLISPFGGQETFAYAAPSEPKAPPTSDLTSWRIGEAWRINATTGTGWRDDRIVRFTGDARHPAAVVFRRLTRGEGNGAQCEPLLQEIGATARPDTR